MPHSIVWLPLKKRGSGRVKAPLLGFRLIALMLVPLQGTLYGPRQFARVELLNTLCRSLKLVVRH